MLMAKDVREKLKEYYFNHELHEKLTVYVEAYVVDWMNIEELKEDAVFPKTFIPVNGVYRTEDNLLYTVMSGDFTMSSDEDLIFGSVLSSYIDLSEKADNLGKLKFIIPIYSFQATYPEEAILEEKGLASYCERIDLTTFDDKEVLVLRSGPIVKVLDVEEE